MRSPQTNTSAGNHPGKNILVTGGGGFLGSAIVRLLVAKGHRVTSFSRQRYLHLDALGVKQLRGDIGNAGAVKDAVRGQDAVFHVAAKAGVWGAAKDYFRINVIGTRHVVTACSSCRVPMLIYTSSPSVVFDGGDMQGVDESVPYPPRYHAPYPWTKAKAERAVRAAADENLQTITLRPHLIWGPGDNHLIPRIIARADHLRQVGDGRNRVDTIYIDNAAKAHVLAMEALENNPALSGQVYFISDDAPIRLWDMINRILAAGGKPAVKRRVSSKMAYVMATVLEWGYRFFGIRNEPPMTRFVARELATAHWFDISAAKRDLGYSADISIDTGMQRLNAWLVENDFYAQ
ncbi:3-beta hydroxysteroid dehydrogenase [Desulfosarcina ovata subsp. sediminis]|uniref:3-beta hydroxysteroid dehydrogenase n=1 Tax=Desulfosarcina ovata subsp. sediminis TaxID=885957 RepID=A0A5K7ZIL7_9BACT|nr:NAD-dependent epimerase/dehydratase family protein [Desulfosarcina ovata]BBO80035.1 3-beta hydroxysteroid dehydrogenase [Desulfosarcina ovata subsp. sediminis]